MEHLQHLDEWKISLEHLCGIFQDNWLNSTVVLL